MRLNGFTVFSTLALSTCLSHAASVNEAVVSLGNRDVLDTGVAIREEAINAANGVDVVDENEDIANEDENEGADEKENVGENEEGNVDENLDEENNENLNDNVDENVDQNEDKNNNNDNNDNQNDLNNVGQVLNGSLGDSFNDINIDPNDIQGSLGQNILNLLLSMGICNFNLNSLSGLNLGNEIQLLLQLQQLQQLQALGIVNSFTVDQLIQREILSNTFNLSEFRGILYRHRPVA